MKEVVYGNGTVKYYDTLLHGYYHGFQFWILNRRFSPTAYVQIPNNHEYYLQDYDECEGVVVHGGFTYSESYLTYWEHSNKYNCMVRTQIKDTWILGWDYNHRGDYSNLPVIMRRDSKKWSTREIYEEVKKVIEQLEAI